jgi:hypothetical protein
MRVADAVQRSPADAQHRPVTMHRRAGTRTCGAVHYLRVFGVALAVFGVTFAVFGIAFSIASTRSTRE